MQKVQVVVQTAFLGDVILTIPFLLRLKSISPSEKLIVVCKKGLGEFLKNDGVVDGFIEIEKSDRQSYAKARQQLKTFHITYLYCIHRSIRSLLFSSQISADQKIGFNSVLGFWVFDECVDYENRWPDAIRKFKLLRSRDQEVKATLSEQDFDILNLADSKGKLPKTPKLFSFPRLQKIVKKQICLFPGSVWATKRWTKIGFTEVARKFNQMGYQVLLLGGADEKSLCDEIALQVSGVKVFAGELTISESLKKVEESLLVVANDSAATHMAAYKNTPAVTVFGATTLNLGFRPWSDESRVVQKELNCRPCGKHGPQKCPLGHHNCMKLIPSEVVIEKSLELLKTNSQ